jgi:hypothetical protein
MEYNDSKIKIEVYNLPLYKRDKSDGTIENPLILKNIKTIKGIQNIELKEAVKLIEFSLSEIIDFLIKKALHDPKITELRIDYYIIGGKAINNIIKLKYLEKSFDFDIHVREEEDILNISKYITDYCNEELNKSYNQQYRRQLYIKLQSLNLVDLECRDYYRDDDLIFFGDRINRTTCNPISGLFIKLKLKKNLFIYNTENIIYTNMYRTGTYLDLVLVDADITNNILYIPIADIDPDALTFGVNVYKPNIESTPSIYKNPLENINYADFSILLFNLLKCIAKVPNKIESNGNKLKKLIKILYYNCNIYYEYDSLDKFNMMYKKIINQLMLHKDTIIYEDGDLMLKQFIDDNNISDLSRNTTYGIFIEKLVNKIINLNDISFKENNCYSFLGTDSIFDRADLFKYGTDITLKLSELEDIIAEYDALGNYYYFLQFSDKLSRNLNIFCYYWYNFINLVVDDYIYNNSTVIKNVLDKYISFNVKTINYKHVMDTMNNIYNDYHSDSRIILIKNEMNDIFNVYSLQHITNFTMMDGLVNRSFIDLSYIKEGDIIQINQYLSTSFNPTVDFFPFLSDTPANRILLKIQINKNNRNWILINRYSEHPTEFEILLKENSIFIIKRIDYGVVSIKNENGDDIKKEYKIISLEICDDLDPIENKLLINKVLNTLPTHISYHILKAPLFIKVLKYVYTTYFTKPYTESHCIYFDYDNELPCAFTDYMENEYDGIIYKYNHALPHTVRVACWIQLLYLQDIIYNSNLFGPRTNSVMNKYFVLKTCIASIFMISGRESEAGFSTSYTDEDLTRNCPGIQPNPYNRYKTASANNFKVYVNLLEIKELNVFTEEEIEDYTYCLKYYSYIYNDYVIPNEIGNNIIITNDTELRKDKRKKIATYFYIAHENDLVRCRDKVRVGTLVPSNHASYKNEQKLSAQLMYDIVKNTGDRIMSTQIIYDVSSTLTRLREDYDIKLFYLCSTNPEYCITIVLNTTDAYFNQLIYNSMETRISEDKVDKKDFVLQNIFESQHSGVPLPVINPPIARGGGISEIFNAFISDDNNIDIDSINVEVNNSNLGSTFYMSRKSYIEIIKENYKKDSSKDDFTNNGIYFQNIYISFDKSKDVNYEQNIYEKIINTKQVDEIEISNYERYVYPQYFIKTVKNKSTAQQIKKYLTVRDDDKVSQSSKKSTDIVVDDPHSVINFKSKYLKYKNKYIELKNKLNL